MSKSIKSQLKNSAFRSPMEAMRDREGGMTVFMALWVTAVFAMGGFAVDTAKAWRMKTMMQAASDSAAHAALWAMQNGEDAGAAALRYVEMNLPAEKYGNVLKGSDIETGGWNETTLSFDPSAEFGKAVRVTLFRSERNDNPEPTTFLRILGIRSWSMSVQTVAGATTSFQWNPEGGDDCSTKGIVARGTVGYTSGNTFDNVCVHGEQGVTMNNGNLYVNETVVSMPDATLLNLGKSVSYKKNNGLAEALVYTELDPAIVDNVDELIQGFALDATPVALADWVPGALQDGDRWYVHCSSPGTMGLPAGVFSDVQVTTNCSVQFSGGAVFSNSVIGTTNDAEQGGGPLDDLVESILFGEQAALETGPSRFADLAESLGLVAHAAKGGIPGAPSDVAEDAVDAVDETVDEAVETVVDLLDADNGNWTMKGAADVAFGDPDACADGGGSLIMADGNIKLASKAGVYGSTVIAASDIQFAANTLGIEGPSILSGGHIDLPANQAMYGCNGSDWRLSVRSIYRLLN